MALVLLGTLFCLCVTGALSEIAVGADCTPAGLCAAHAVCDKVQAKCLIIHGQSCASNTDKCVSNATCDATNVCKCDATKTINSAAGLCLLKTGQTCADKSSCVVGAACQTSTCKCTNGFAENTTTKLCEAKAGIACSLDVPCVTSTTCESGTCAIKLGQSCVGNTDKCVSKAACVNNVCKPADTTAIPTVPKNKASNSTSLSFWLLLAALMSMCLADSVM